jgi:hypothetical protein
MKVMNIAEHMRDEHKYEPLPPKKKTSVIMTRVKDWRRDLVSMIMKLGFYKVRGNVIIYGT